MTLTPAEELRALAEVLRINGFQTLSRDLDSISKWANAEQAAYLLSILRGGK